MTDDKAKLWLIYPYVCAVYPVIHVLAANSDNNASFGRITALCAGMCALTWVALAGLCRTGAERGQAAFFWSGGVLLFFSYSPIYWTLERIGVSPRFRYLFATVLVLLVALTVLTLRSRRLDDPSVVRTLNRASLVMLIMPLGMIATGLRSVTPIPGAESAFAAGVGVVTNKATLPRAVFFIVLDSYAGDDALFESLGYDNSPFTDELRSLGFSVPARSASNYSTTFLSLSSTLNMAYLDELAGLTQADLRGRWSEIFQRQAAARLLKAQGFEFVWLGPGYDLDRTNALADRSIDCSALGEFEAVLLDNSFLSVVMDWYGLGPGKASRVSCMWEALRELTPAGRPVFVVAHLPAPHAPWVLGQTETWRIATAKPGAGRDWLDRQKYLAEIGYLNQEVISTTHAILKNWGPNVVIALQGDHGLPWSFFATSPLPQQVRDRMRIFNALYLPADDRGDLPETMTSVNTFRLIFERCFGLHMPRLPDRVLFSSEKDAFNFQDVRLDSLW